MPTYVYEVIEADGSSGEQFEVLQKISDDPLTHHPDSGKPVRRVICAPNILGRWSDMSMDRRLKDDKKLDQMGFTKYVKSGDGTYEKRAGGGPNVISADGPVGS